MDKTLLSQKFSKQYKYYLWTKCYSKLITCIDSCQQPRYGDYYYYLYRSHGNSCTEAISHLFIFIWLISSRTSIQTPEQIAAKYWHTFILCTVFFYLETFKLPYRYEIINDVKNWKLPMLQIHFYFSTNIIPILHIWYPEKSCYEWWPQLK